MAFSIGRQQELRVNCEGSREIFCASYEQASIANIFEQDVNTTCVESLKSILMDSLTVVSSNITIAHSDNDLQRGDRYQ